MKKVLLLILVFFMMIFTVAGCKNGNDTPPEVEGGDEENTEVYDAVGFTIHYNRSDNNYANWGLWLWDHGIFQARVLEWGAIAFSNA